MSPVPSMLYYGDNLAILRNRDYFPSESIDLVYLDPPFNSNQDYNVLFSEADGTRSAAQIEAFTDTWRWDVSARRTFDETIEAGGRAAEALVAFRSLVGESDMLAYLSMMAPRLTELRRVLRPTGSIYLHCDPTASHYLKLLMDAVFEPGNFRNEIVWRYRKYQKAEMHSFTSNSDRLLFYVKGPEADVRFEPQFIELDKPKRFLKRVWDKKSGRIVNAKDERGKVQYVEFTREKIDDVWDLTYLMPAARERLGFPTQKPEALLDRVISASSRPGETVLDPFCGCGTTVAAAQRLGRRWIGIDVTHLAITLIRSRLADAYGESVSYKVIGEPADLNGAEALAKLDRYQFQWWALGKIRARPVAEERKKGADSGIDGKLFFREKDGGAVKTIVIQVKSGGLKLSEVRDFGRVIEREKAQIGVLLSLDEPTRDMRTEAASMNYYKPEYRLSQDDKYDRYQILTIRELFEGKQPAYPPFRNVTFKVAPAAPAPMARSKGRIRKLSLPGFPGQGVLRSDENDSNIAPDDPSE